MKDIRKPMKPGAQRPGKPHSTASKGSPTNADMIDRRAAQGPARHRVCWLLVSQVDAFPDLRLVDLDTTGLDDRDAALAHMIYHAVMQRWLTLQYVLEAGLSKPWDNMDPKLRAALLCGAAQLLLLDRVPIHAAINEAVEWSKYVTSQRGGGLVNAVLRRVAELLDEPADGSGTRREEWTDRRDEILMPDGSARALAKEVLPEDTLTRLSVVTSHPASLLREWMKTMPLREVRALATHGLASPPVILNTAWTREAIREDILSPHTAPGHHVFRGQHSELVGMLRSRDDLWVQDPASSLAVGSVTDLKPEVVIDVCAGQGTKTRQLMHAFPEATILATDIDQPRFAALSKTFAGQERVRVVPFDRLGEANGTADLVLLDVPCSNTGVLARRVEAKYRHDPDRTNSLLSTQRQIIADAIPLLKIVGGGAGKGGLLYSTCSLDPQENEEHARWAARWHGFEITREHRRPPSGGPGEPAERYSDGSYAVLLS